MRVAIIGLYNSGSSALSEIMESLGFEIGRPLWEDFYESRALRAQLVDWWDEPRLVEKVAQEDRVPFLRWWAEHYESRNPLICAKHPLLCLSAFDLDKAWGPGFKVIHSARPLEESIAGLKRRRWFSDPARMQRTLHEAAERYFAVREHHAVEYADLLNDPQKEIRRLLAYLELHRSDEEIERAAALVRRPSSSGWRIPRLLRF